MDQLDRLLQRTDYAVTANSITYGDIPVCMYGVVLQIQVHLEAIEAALALIDILDLTDYTYSICLHKGVVLTDDQARKIRSMLIMYDRSSPSNKLIRTIKRFGHCDVNEPVTLCDLTFRGRPISWTGDGYIKGSYALVTNEDISLDDYPEVTHIYNILTGVETMRYTGDDSILTVFDDYDRQDCQSRKSSRSCQ